jgi:hypothetical protein
MQTSDFIAILALITSVVSITYTVIVDRRRPKLRVRGAIVHLYDRAPGHVERHGPYFSVSATNHGPGRVCVNGLAVARKGRIRKWLKRILKRTETEGVVLDPLANSPNRLPKWLEVGESLTLLYPADGDLVAQTDFDRLCLFDSIGGQHWSQRKVFVAARESLAKGEGA